MNVFKHITVVDKISITDLAKKDLVKYSHSKIVFPNFDSRNDGERISRIGDSDAVLGSWQTKINDKILSNAPNLKYIGICGTSLANIDLDAVRRRGIVLKNVVDYGDEGVAEYIFAQLLSLFRGLGKYRWCKGARELCGKTIGIIGLGATGQQVARVALGFKMNVLYYSRTRKRLWEKKGLSYKSLASLLRVSDIISLHVPKNLKIMGEKEFGYMSDGKILVDTCLGVVYQNFDVVKKWLSFENNYLIRDFQPDIEKSLKK